MKRLNGMDAMLLYSETPNLHTHTLKVAIVHAADFEGEFTFDVFRRTIARRLHLLDPLRYQLVDVARATGYANLRCEYRAGRHARYLAAA